MSVENTSAPPPPPAAPIGPGNHDRAWNDPPMFSTEVNVAARPPANKLNKRVAHPVCSQPAVSPGFPNTPGIPNTSPSESPITMPPPPSSSVLNLSPSATQ